MNFLQNKIKLKKFINNYTQVIFYVKKYKAYITI